MMNDEMMFRGITTPLAGNFASAKDGSGDSANFVAGESLIDSLPDSCAAPITKSLLSALECFSSGDHYSTGKTGRSLNTGDGAVKLIFGPTFFVAYKPIATSKAYAYNIRSLVYAFSRAVNLPYALRFVFSLETIFASRTNIHLESIA